MKKSLFIINLALIISLGIFSCGTKKQPSSKIETYSGSHNYGEDQAKIDSLKREADKKKKTSNTSGGKNN